VDPGTAFSGIWGFGVPLSLGRGMWRADDRHELKGNPAPENARVWSGRTGRFRENTTGSWLLDGRFGAGRSWRPYVDGNAWELGEGISAGAAGDRRFEEARGTPRSSSRACCRTKKGVLLGRLTGPRRTRFTATPLARCPGS